MILSTLIILLIMNIIGLLNYKKIWSKLFLIIEIIVLIISMIWYLI